MLLNLSKKNALIQLINCKEKWTVKNIGDLFDGKLFCDIIEEVFPETFELLKNEGQITFNCEEQSKDQALCTSVDMELEDENQEMIREDAKCENTVIKDSGEVQKSDTELITSAAHDSEPIMPTTSANESVPEQVHSTARDEEAVTKSTISVVSDPGSISEPVESAKNITEPLTELVKLSEKEIKLITNRYRLIQYFIDVRYNLRSETVITFSECWEKKELELAKVLIFVMSEVVRHYVRTNDPLIQTLSHVDAPVQHDLEKCFNFFINERNKITKKEVEKILTSSAPYKISSSPNNGYYSTPRRCSSKYRRISPKSTQSQENIYTDSPLKTYFESPVFTKADILSKEKEILKMKQILYEEESNSCSLEQQVQDLKKKLEERDKEIKKFKMRNRMLQENVETEDCKNCIKQKKIIEEYTRRIEELEIDIKEHNEETRKEFEDLFINYQIEVAESMSEFNYQMRNAEMEIKEVTEQLQKTKTEKDEFEEIVKKLSEELDEKVKELEVFKEKLSYADRKNTEEPKSPVIGECMGTYFKEENGMNSFDISHIKLADHPEKISVQHVMVQFPERESYTEYQVESGLSNPELSVSNNLPDWENSHNSEKFSDNIKNEDPNISAKLDTQSNQFLCSASKEIPTVDISYPSVTENGIGSLWRQYDNSASENENRNNNYIPVTDEGFGTACQNNNILEIENTDAISCADNGLSKTLSILHKTEFNLNQLSKYLSTTSKVSSGPNGSNGFYGSSIEFLEEFEKSVQISLLCLSQARESLINFQNNNSISKKMIEVVGSDDVLSKCFVCSKVGNDISNDTKVTTVKKENQESAIVHPKTQPDSLKEKYEGLKEKYEGLKEKYEMVLKILADRDKELEKCTKKYSHLKVMYQECLVQIKELKLIKKKFESQLKEAGKRENDALRELKKKKYFFTFHVKGLNETIKKLQSTIVTFEMEMSHLNEEKKKLLDELSSQKKQMLSHIKLLTKELEAAFVKINELSSTSNASEENKCVKGKNDAVSEDIGGGVCKIEYPPSEAVSQDTDNESVISCALNHKSFHSGGGLHLHNYDEEEFLNHSSLIAIQNGRESPPDFSRIHELVRRNTLLPSHLQSHYAVEGLPATPIDKNFSNYIKDKKLNAGEPEYLPTNNVHIGLKRKVSDEESQLSTPVVKTKRKFLQTPTSLKNWCLYRRNHRRGSIQPKP